MPGPILNSLQKDPGGGDAFVGSFDDRITLNLGDKNVKVAESYEVNCGVFSQPSAFTVVVGHGGILSQLIRMATPRTEFKLLVGATVVQTGFVDGVSAGGAAATASVHGRDKLQDLHDSYAEVERHFTETDFRAFIEAVAKHAKLDKPTIHFTSDALRKQMALGRALPAPAVREQVKITGKVLMHLGDRYYDFIKRVLDRGGLFMYAAPNGEFVVSAPNKDIAPIYRLVHAPSDKKKIANVEDFGFTFNTSDRVANYIAYARGGGKDIGILKYEGSFPDKEMLDWGYKRNRSFRDWHLQSSAQAELLARRKIAEERRKGWQLHVMVAGHRTKLISGEMAVWRPDTMVHFDSDQLNFHGVYYIENVRYMRSNESTTTELRLVRPEDLVFGSEELGD